MEQLDILIDERAKQGDDKKEREDMYTESVRRSHAKRRRRNLERWISYHLDQAERLERIAASMAEVHRARAAALSEEEPGEVAS
jgi:hypothetical protein